jgi:hypothetical protein
MVLASDGNEGEVVEPVADDVVEGGGEPKVTPSPLEPGGVRFEQIYGKMKDYEAQVNQYKELGDAAEIRRIRAEHAQWKQALDEYKTQQARTPDQQAEAARAKAIREELIKVYPELADAATVKELREQLNEVRSSLTEQSLRATLSKASETFSEVLKANKIDLKYQGKIEDYIAAQMSDEDKRAMLSGDFSVAEKIFTNEMKEGIFAGLRVQQSPPRPATRNTTGGTPPAAKGAKASTLKDAETEAFARLGL